MPAEQLPSQPYEKEPSSLLSIPETEVRFDLHASQLGTPNEGRLGAAAHAAAIRATSPEQLPVQDHEKQLRDYLRAVSRGVVLHLRQDKLAEQEAADIQQGYELTERQ
jgi:hypothetical protein